MPDSFARIGASYLEELEKLLREIDLSSTERVVHILRDARDQGATIYVAGNGGSAATASHWVNDLCKAARLSGRTPIRAMCLSDNMSWVTALANDEGYERVFAGQLENFARPGDVLLLISASGNSANLVRAVEAARAREVHSVALLGFDGGVLKELVDDFIWLPTEIGAYGLVETGHSVVTDIITTCLIRDVPDEGSEPIGPDKGRA